MQVRGSSVSAGRYYGKSTDTITTHEDHNLGKHLLAATARLCESATESPAIASRWIIRVYERQKLARIARVSSKLEATNDCYLGPGLGSDSCVERTVPHRRKMAWEL